MRGRQINNKINVRESDHVLGVECFYLVDIWPSGFCDHGNETSWAYERRGISWLVERLLTSEKNSAVELD